MLWLAVLLHSCNLVKSVGKVGLQAQSLFVFLQFVHQLLPIVQGKLHSMSLAITAREVLKRNFHSTADALFEECDAVVDSKN